MVVAGGPVTTRNLSSGLTLSQLFPSLEHVPQTGVFSSHFLFVSCSLVWGSVLGVPLCDGRGSPCSHYATEQCWFSLALRVQVCTLDTSELRLDIIIQSPREKRLSDESRTDVDRSEFATVGGQWQRGKLMKWCHGSNVCFFRPHLG